MRSMRDDGIDIELIAEYFNYNVSSVEKLITWHEGLYPTIQPFDGDSELWREFLARRQMPFKAQG